MTAITTDRITSTKSGEKVYLFQFGPLSYDGNRTSFDWSGHSYNSIQQAFEAAVRESEDSEESIDILKDIIMARLRQDAYFRKHLLLTTGATVGYCAGKYKEKIGTGLRVERREVLTKASWPGQNQYGQALQQVRDELYEPENEQLLNHNNRGVSEFELLDGRQAMAFMGGIFSNFFKTKIWYKKESYAFPELAYQASKALHFGDTAAAAAIASCPTPLDAARLGSTVVGFDQAAWDLVKYKVMLGITRAKAYAYEDFYNCLMATGSKVILEASASDTEFGVGMPLYHPTINDPTTWKGKNLMGICLMELRASFRRNPLAKWNMLGSGRDGDEDEPAKKKKCPMAEGDECLRSEHIIKISKGNYFFFISGNHLRCNGYWPQKLEWRGKRYDSIKQAMESYEEGEIAAERCLDNMDRYDVMLEIVEAMALCNPAFKTHIIETALCSKIVSCLDPDGGKDEDFWTCGLKQNSPIVHDPELWPGSNAYGEAVTEVRQKLLWMPDLRPPQPFCMEEMSGDVMAVVDKCHQALVHCIPVDLRMGMGFAKQVKDKYGADYMNTISNQQTTQWLLPEGPLGHTLVYKPKDDFYVFSLQTKLRYFNKPTYTAIRKGLQDVLVICRRFNISDIGMPMIGCGLDSRLWHVVECIIKGVFKNSQIKISVYKNPNTNIWE